MLQQENRQHDRTTLIEKVFFLKLSIKIEIRRGKKKLLQRHMYPQNLFKIHRL